jgi:hypothetical protein
MSKLIPFKGNSFLKRLQGKENSHITLTTSKWNLIQTQKSQVTIQS